MKIKTTELTGVSLAWSVAVADAKTISFDQEAPPKIEADFFVRWSSWRQTNMLFSYKLGSYYEPHKIAQQGHQIIEREKIGPTWCELSKRWTLPHPKNALAMHIVGDTQLVAAMRCFVARYLGDEVDIPEELLAPTSIVIAEGSHATMGTSAISINF